MSSVDSAGSSNLSAQTRSSKQARYILDKARLWPVGATLKVAFHGATQALESRVATIAPEWSKYGNIKFDFGYDPVSHRYRQWSPNDTVHKGDIRIEFADDDVNQSQVGTDSLRSAAGKRSMHLDTSDVLDPIWSQRRVLHEFGHALGFKHEHQNPHGNCGLRWEDDAGYLKTEHDGEFIPDVLGRLPGIYTITSGAPWHWDKDATDRNIKPFDDEIGLALSELDTNSIMIYALPAEFYQDGESSPCYVGLNTKLSDLDKAGVASWYPFGHNGQRGPQ